jgi:hypothetical protein
LTLGADVADAIRIVPLQPEGELQPVAAAPELTYRGGPLLTNVEVVTVYWGAAWRNEPIASVARRLDVFFDFLVTSEVMDQLSEYGAGHGTRVGSSTLDNVPAAEIVSDQQIREVLSAGLPSLPEPNANRVYVIFLPPGVPVAMGGSRSCEGFCGYHDAIDGRIFYAVLPYPGCAGCTGRQGEFTALTVTASHELAEAITDPVPGTGWYDDLHGEVGDVCSWHTKQLDDYVVQREWSNAAGACS